MHFQLQLWSTFFGGKVRLVGAVLVQLQTQGAFQVQQAALGVQHREFAQLGAMLVGGLLAMGWVQRRRARH